MDLALPSTVAGLDGESQRLCVNDLLDVYGRHVELLRRLSSCEGT